MSEAAVLKRIMLACSRGGSRLFRNQVGSYKLADGRYLTSGLCVGSSDLIGWQKVTITPEMVGKVTCVFVALEVKDTNGRLRDEQRLFLDNVNSSGGIGLVVRSVEDVQIGVSKYIHGLSS